MLAQLVLPFVSIVGASSAAPPEACAEVQRPRRRVGVKKLPPVGEAEPLAKPAPGDDRGGLDVHDYLVRHSETSFFFPMRGDAMAGAEIFDGDMLVVDRHIQPAHGHIVLAYFNGERMVRRLHHQGRKTALHTDNPDDPELRLEDGTELVVWGVVVGKFKRLL